MSKEVRERVVGWGWKSMKGKIEERGNLYSKSHSKWMRALHLLVWCVRVEYGVWMLQYDMPALSHLLMD